MDMGGYVGAKCCGRATGCGTNSSNAYEKADKLYVSLVENMLSEA